jgi:ComF family protein
MDRLLARAHRAALDLLFPPACALCGRHGALLCASCGAEVTPAGGPRCPGCWAPSPRRCRHCRAQPPAFASLRSAYVLQGGARRLAHELKYEGLTSLAETMADLMHERLPADDADVVTAVPLHPRRERLRGYNQAARIARRLADLRALPYDGRCVRRVRDTAPLATGMGRDERRAIMHDAFRAVPGRVEGKRVLLVDDTATTGATLDACARALLDAGAAGVRCVTWARAD